MTNQNYETKRNQARGLLRTLGRIEYIIGKFGQYGGLLTGVDSLIDNDPSAALLGLPLYVGGAYISDVGFAKRLLNTERGHENE